LPSGRDKRVIDLGKSHAPVAGRAVGTFVACSSARPAGPEPFRWCELQGRVHRRE